MKLRILSLLGLALLVSAPSAVADDDVEAQLGAALEAAIARHERSLDAMDSRISQLERKAVKTEAALAKAREQGNENHERKVSVRLDQIKKLVAEVAARRDAHRRKPPTIEDPRKAAPGTPQTRVWEVGGLLDADVDVSALFQLLMPGVRAVVVRGRYAATTGGDPNALRSRLDDTVRKQRWPERQPEDKLQVFDVGDLIPDERRRAAVVPLVEVPLLVEGLRETRERAAIRSRDELAAFGAEVDRLRQRAEFQRKHLEGADDDTSAAVTAAALARLAEAEERTVAHQKRVNEFKTALADAQRLRAAASTIEENRRLGDRVAELERKLAKLDVAAAATATDAQGRFLLRALAPGRHVVDGTTSQNPFREWVTLREAETSKDQADTLKALRDDVQALRGEVRELTGLIRELLATRGR